jgi:hypothetical protein
MVRWINAEVAEAGPSQPRDGRGQIHRQDVT